MTRYILHPGYVTSKNDGERHYISGLRLMQLYGVNRRDCTIIEGDGFRSLSKYRGQPGDVHLHPRRDGDYRLPVLPET